MSSSSIKPNEEFQCPLCLVNNRAAAKFCRKCGRPRDVLTQFVAPTVYETIAIPEAVAFIEAPLVVEVVDLSENDAVKVAAAVEMAYTASGENSDISSGNSLTPIGTVANNRPNMRVNPECPGCCSSVRAGDRFCCWCGEAQPLRTAQSRICPDCSQSLAERANFCFQCGQPVAGPEKLRMRIPAELFCEESEFFPTFEV
jgi:membrane protease subunit (stomatin/prohibitin family)